MKISCLEAADKNKISFLMHLFYFAHSLVRNINKSKCEKYCVCYMMFLLFLLTKRAIIIWQIIYLKGSPPHFLKAGNGKKLSAELGFAEEKTIHSFPSKIFVDVGIEHILFHGGRKVKMSEHIFSIKISCGSFPLPRREFSGK